MAFARVLVILAECYAAIGLVAGLAFILFGIDRVNPAARGALSFRPLLLPGFALIWPVALAR
jgi:hypothetical protein